MSILKICHQRIFPVLVILHRCLETASLTWLLLVKPAPERVEYRFFFFKTIGFSLLKCVLLAGVKRNSCRTNSLPIGSRAAPHSSQTLSSSGSEIISSRDGTPLKSSSRVRFFLRVCSWTLIAGALRSTSASCSAS